MLPCWGRCSTGALLAKPTFWPSGVALHALLTNQNTWKLLIHKQVPRHIPPNFTNGQLDLSSFWLKQVKDGVTYVYNVTFAMHPSFAQGVYESCMDVAMGGGTVVRAEFNTYQKFFLWMGTANPVQIITYVPSCTPIFKNYVLTLNVSFSCLHRFIYKENNSFSADVQACADSCSWYFIHNQSQGNCKYSSPSIAKTAEQHASFQTLIWAWMTPNAKQPSLAKNSTASL